MSDVIQKIVETTTLSTLIHALNEFVQKVGEDDTQMCMSLVETVCAVIEELERDITNSSLYIVDESNSSLFLFRSYLIVCEDARDVMDSIHDFIMNCSAFTEDNEESENAESLNEKSIGDELQEASATCSGGDCRIKITSSDDLQLRIEQNHMIDHVRAKKRIIYFILYKPPPDTNWNNLLTKGYTTYYHKENTVWRVRMPYEYIFS